jgi:hypothetical protein
MTKETDNLEDFLNCIEMAQYHPKLVVSDIK